MCPATHLDPGVVAGELVTGHRARWTSAGGRRGATRSSERGRRRRCRPRRSPSVPRDDIARWKWGKLLMNLGNAVEAVFAPDERRRGARRARAARGRRVPRRRGHRRRRRRGGRRAPRRRCSPRGRSASRRRGGGSTWQSLTRATGAVETDYLTGEIVLLGRLVGVPTPVNERLQPLANELARTHEPPASRSAGERPRRARARAADVASRDAGARDAGSVASDAVGARDAREATWEPQS